MKTTNKHFEIFKKEVKYWVKEFGLTNWEVFFRHGGNVKGSFGGCAMRPVYKAATMFFAKNWDNAINPLTEESIKKTAFHETMHLLLGRYSMVANSRYIGDADIDEAEEEVIRILENYIWKKVER